MLDEVDEPEDPPVSASTGGYELDPVRDDEPDRGTDANSTGAEHDDGTTASTESDGDTGGGGTTTGISSEDESSDDRPPQAPSCDERYGDAPDYVSCIETEDECHFNARTDGGTCRQMCASLGGRCLAAFDNPNEQGLQCEILRPNTDDCDSARYTEICVCDRPRK